MGGCNQTYLPTSKIELKHETLIQSGWSAGMAEASIHRLGIILSSS